MSLSITNGTRIYYNQVWLYNVHTDMIEQEIAYDKSGTDHVANKVRITCTALVHKFGAGQDGESAIGTHVGTSRNTLPYATTGQTNDDISRFTEVIERLNQPRCHFMYVLGDNPVFDVAPYAVANAMDVTYLRQVYYQVATGAGDTAGGAPYGVGFDATYDMENEVRVAVRDTPKTTCKINKVINQTSAWVTFTVEFDYLPYSCKGVGGAKYQGRNSDVFEDNVLSMRWWIADDIDCNTWLTRRLYRGQIEMVGRLENVHFLRYTAIPPLARGMQRKRIALQEDPTGLVMDFEVEDQEIIATPPIPGASWDGSLELEFPPRFYGPVQATMAVELTGPKGINKLQLSKAVFGIIDAKLNWFNRVKTESNSMWLEQFRLRESIKDNKITGVAKFQFVNPGLTDGGDGDFNQGQWISRMVGDTIGNNMMKSVVDPTDPPPSPDDDITYGPRAWGIEGYDNQQYIWRAPPNSSLSGIIYCALQSPCQVNDGFPNSAYDFFQEDPDKRTNANGEEKKKPAGEDDQQANQQNNDNFQSYGQNAMTTLNPKSESPYMHYRLTSRYEWDMGREKMPNSGPSSNFFVPEDQRYASVYQSRTAQCSRELRVSASRQNRWPVMPNEKDFYDEEMDTWFLTRNLVIEANSVQASADGSKHLFSVEAVAKYDLSKPPTAEDMLLVGTPPFINRETSNNQTLSDVLYIGNGSRKHGGDFIPPDDGGVEDIGPDTPPDPGGESPDDPVIPIP